MTTVVIGGGVAGLTAARRLAESGRDVVLLEASAVLGGRVGSHELAGIPLDSGAESFAVRGGIVARLLGEVGLAGDVVDPIPGGAWIALKDRTVPLPAAGLLGIPSSPLADEVRLVLGARGSARAYLDRVLPVLHVGRYRHLGPLVRARMGTAVLERLVAPVVESVYGADPDEVEIDAILPTLNAAITATGALSAAVERLRAASPAGSAVQGVQGGLLRLPQALAMDALARGVRLVTGARVTTLAPGPLPGTWEVGTDDERLDATNVVVAVDGAAALDLLQQALPHLLALARPAPADSRVVTLLVEDARLDARPRGSGVLRASGRADVRARALTHLTAKWQWLHDLLPPGQHLLRLSYRGADPVDDAEAGADASSLLGVPLPAAIARDDALWRDTLPPLAPETLAARTAVDAQLQAVRGLVVTGSWRTGTGLAAVVSGAERAAAALTARRG
ncbi:protoporphyrinogen/coproporphyrinogen oxidase [uncultured Amnibacterium sp.]|uniref:protoporphyrinogen/coproporphyrinogen oxidase n=1 Tax=uncultured Amnibacterium sp. TaxID=1631851 RepID=UPI0035CA1F05